MVIKRHSHTAIISGESGRLVLGGWIPGEPFEIAVKGQYFPSNSGSQLKKNVDGKEFIVKGEFSTRHKKNESAKRIKIESIGLDEKIEAWEQFQTHSVIYI